MTAFAVQCGAPAGGARSAGSGTHCPRCSRIRRTTPGSSISAMRNIGTLRNRKLSKGQFIEYATYVPSGVAEVTRLQQREGYAYLKP